ncbi:pullulanase-type alpha-1,6-glucosidase [Colwellia sp. 1_MG-2023]|uniref:pullulanase-type alpha-1,6-glucosidase n=1 Tax=Colwellia sp. 1_MG-2023 TaxID=3062649 RepID=UPI0026E3BF83|nr:pullulanase-type alpha-1,6-glucosidase [Colwellia sp. 1_MG-2023]MDO6445358.1 pullulanase-type alpha-1,6-glucosidase [Colwellia sp. 1_MG-2023]
MRRLPLTLLTTTLLLGACDKPITEHSTNKISKNQFSMVKLSNIHSDFSAHWLTPNLILLPKSQLESQYTLLSLPASRSNETTSDTQFNDALLSISLTQTSLPEKLAEKFPHLKDFQAFTVNLPTEDTKLWLKKPLMVVESNKQNTPMKGAYVQTANVIDALYTAGENDANEITDLGATIKADSVQFKLWAPTALSVKVKLFNDDKSPTTPNSVTLKEDKKTGAWSAQVEKDFHNKYYRYEVEVYHPVSKKIELLTVTDPYSLSLSTNSKYSHIIDLGQQSTLPDGWFEQHDNPVVNPEDNIFYETHIRDFSAHDSSISQPLNRGKYLAFTEQNSDGIKHLKALKSAGINSIHLLPTFDIGTVNENSEQVIDLNDPISKACQVTKSDLLCDEKIDADISIREYLTQLPKSDGSRQAIVTAVKAVDNYNWGYDPFHYTVPEGSYAINPEGSARIREFRTMVQRLHNLGFRVIMDVVYNHTHQAGLEPTAILDKIVPNYYHRLDPITGEIAQSTCCDNTATERAMMEKLMIDSLVVWTRDYKIDGFRFDLMAHQPKSAMLKARAAVQAIDADNYFYGEGWNFGEVANNQRFTQASQLALSGTEIGTFTDRLRDDIRGGAFTAQGAQLRKDQGIGNGLATIPNELNSENITESINHYFIMADQLRIGLTGNLINFPLVTYKGETALGKDIRYGDQPSGYALDPADTINYVSKHDNQTLWDNNQYRIAYDVSTHDRVRMQLQSLAFVVFAQGIPFIHMGSELLRSKGFLRDSYDYGDWYNRVDFSKQSNNYDIGLPPAEKDQANWQIIQEVLKRNEGRDIVSPDDIAFSSEVFLELINIRMSSPLYRLTTAEDIIEKVRFHNAGKDQQLGLIIMSIKGNQQEPAQLVVFNTSAEAKSFTLAEFTQYQLHPILANGVDSRVKQSVNKQGTFTIPALTTSVFTDRLP